MIYIPGSFLRQDVRAFETWMRVLYGSIVLGCCIYESIMTLWWVFK